MTTTEIDNIAAVSAPEKKRSGVIRRLLKKPLGLISLIVLIVIVLLGVFAQFFSAHDATFTSLQVVNAPPGTPGYILGADQNGRDIWARILVSINVSVISGLIGAGVATLVGTLFGLLAGYVGKKTDAITSWTFNLLMTFPALVLVLVLSPVTGGAYQATMFIFGLFLAPSTYRLVRNLVVGVKNELYVDAARVSGLSNRRILSRHVLYVVRGPIIISVSFLATAAIGIQSGLAFLGVGSTLTPSFGSMTSDAFINVYSYPLQLVWPSVVQALLTSALILLGNAYRDALTDAERPTRAERRAAASAAATRTRMVRARTAGAPDVSSARSLLTVRNLSVGYAQTDGVLKSVVDGVSLDVAPGEIVGLVGESGSGKTQTAFSILGLLPPEAQVEADVLTIAGDSLVAKDSRELRKMRGSVIAYIPQEPMSNLDPSFTIGSQLVEGLMAGMSRKEAKATILQLLARVGIADPERTFASYPHQISGGMAQRVLIAGAVASRPKLLIADEPTTALDVTIQAEILDLLRDLQGELGMGVLLVTHNFGVVADLCDRVVVMRNGQVVETGKVRAIFHEPAHEYTQQLIASILDENTVRTDPAPHSDMRELEETK
ncbi:dipeptide/oligopeptide/nickel ABC transporter permease/ATP-binding protein [Arthrobacter sp. efr-133-TYG-118]|uniref:dipeptide/oligopeptide/nickel ABC transporter permease/ATP-binding protein n=1 Tax=Arthrobacter sp. efr-133-TYG-118 TaxID=3040279 RepID=UPI00254A029D|nr:dipeptide/oligopeptide/nickel ABC transporter permease/ATP-binding protein [Arthrobacter sp. efr-133-TYG-118]